MVPPPNELRGIPRLGLVPDQEIRRYIQNLSPAAMKSSPTEAINIEHFLGLCLCGSSTSLGCTRRYIYATVSSADG
ncbi:hypothetical protein PoB_003997900 [Plakobranchus ocellatus]|uniref:Uncharacterized protein n=1 Tax=Plakobranchus ocellatus TaxID=259542 RepID=A0AAV4B0E8_9GAST|nr:hypothetical protein PoB_003997900 [Plakobranchus ocellatus]